MSIAPKTRMMRVPYTKFLPAVPKTPLESWWTRPELQRDRIAFQHQLIATEIDRLNNGSQRFGGSRQTHDKFAGWPKSPK